MSYVHKIKDRASTNRMAKTIDGYIKLLGTGSDDFMRALDVVVAKYDENQKAFDEVTMMYYIKFSMADIYELYKMFFTANDIWQRNLLDRTMAVHIYEFITGVRKLIGTRMDTLIRKIKDEEIEKCLANTRLLFRAFEAKCEGMKTIRNNVSAHKDKDIRRQLKIINGLNEDEFHLFMVEFQLFTANFIKLDICRNKKLFNN